MWWIIFIIALLLGAAWAKDLASGIAGLFGVIGTLAFIGAGLLLLFVAIMWVINKFKE